MDAELAYQISGNVWEWCLNKWDKPEDTAVDKSGNRVLRGSSWGYGENFVRNYNRYDFTPVNCDYDVGFRVVVVRSPSHGH
jgi:formylglycine-generating enzyme required for sulfatase activity